MYHSNVFAFMYVCVGVCMYARIHMFIGFEVSKELNLDKCSYDVASNNMVIIFAKAENLLRIWLEEEDMKDGGSGKVLRSRNIDTTVFDEGSRADKEGRLNHEVGEDKDSITDNNSNISSPYEGKASAAQILEHNIKRVTGKIDELKYQSAELIYELD